MRLPERLDEGGMLEDPYVRLVLEPWGDAAAAQVRILQLIPTFVD